MSSAKWRSFCLGLNVLKSVNDNLIENDPQILTAFAMSRVIFLETMLKSQLYLKLPFLGLYSIAVYLQLMSDHHFTYAGLMPSQNVVLTLHKIYFAQSEHIWGYIASPLGAKPLPELIIIYWQLHP